MSAAMKIFWPKLSKISVIPKHSRLGHPTSSQKIVILILKKTCLRIQVPNLIFSATLKKGILVCQYSKTKSGGETWTFEGEKGDKLRTQTILKIRGTNRTDEKRETETAIRQS